jgi:LuxR family glucitol operon transcriptional activator
VKELLVRVTPSTIGQILSALESDLRHLIVLHLEGQLLLEELLGKELLIKYQERCLQEQGRMETVSLQELLSYADFADTYQILNTHRHLLPASLASQIRLLTPQLEKLVAVRNRVAHNRDLYYNDCERTQEVIQRLLQGQENHWKQVRVSISRLEEAQLGLRVPRMHNLPSPDYEETGFIGRKKQVEALKKHCLQSPYPVITVFGDGGVGKTALVLKAAYDLLEAPECPFDAIIWTSSKTMQLTPHEIKRISASIRTSTEMLQDVASHLAPAGIENPFAEVLAYLTTFNMLLILDNLETVLDDHIRQFLGNLPSCSKVIITSRLAIGAYDLPMQLLPLDGGESLQLLRALADIRQVPALSKVPNAQLAAYCRRMKHNPLFIKWFVSCVQTGKRPEEILDKRELFLEYCMSNVYDYLSPASQHVLGALLCLPGQRSQAELAFLTQMKAVDLEQALRQIRGTTMLTVSNTPHGSSFESKFELSELARDYLGRHHPVSAREEGQLRQRQQRLIAYAEQAKAERASDTYQFHHIVRREPGDIIVAKYLSDAHNAAEQSHFTLAEDYLAQARNLAPHYFEVFRIEAAIRILQQNFSAARAAYEVALELEPNSAPLHFWYGGFLLRDLQEAEVALKEFQEAARLDPTAVDIRAEIARAMLYLRQFEEARISLDQLLQQGGTFKAALRRKIYDLNLQFYRRQADYLLTQRDQQGALRALEQLRRAYEQYPAHMLDKKMQENLWKGRHLLRLCFNSLYDEEAKARANALLAWFVHVLDLHTEAIPPGVRQEGTILRLPPGKDYGFIGTADGREYYLKRSNLVHPEQWDDLRKGQRVSFEVADTLGGPRPLAITIRVIEST